MGLLKYITQAFSGGWGFAEDEHPFEDGEVKVETKTPREPYVIYDENGIRIKANGEQLKFVLRHLIAVARKSPILRMWLYLKCVPQEYKKLEVERDYYKKKYEEAIGVMQHQTKQNIGVTQRLLSPTIVTEMKKNDKRPLKQKTTRKYTKRAKS